MSPELEDQAALYLLDQLDPNDRAAFEERLLGDAELTELLREMERTLARKIQTLPQALPGRRVFAGIDARIDAASTSPFVLERRPERPLWMTVARWGIAAVIALSLGTIAVQQVRRGSLSDRPVIVVVGLDPAQTRSAQFTLKERPRDSDASFIQLASLAEQFWEKPQNLPAASRSNSGTGQGYAVYDPSSNQGFIGVRNLPALEPGQRYHLWLEDPQTGQFQEAGSLPDAASAGGLYSFSVPVSARPESVGFFVSVEDAARPATSPRGKVVLGRKTI
ncbi:MAG: anti-sigma factor [Opitutus sp.]